MGKNRLNELSMFFISIPMQAFNIFATVLYEVNTFLQIFHYFLGLYKGNASTYNLFIASIWETGTFIFLLRLIYGKAVPKIKMCLPYTRKLFTFDACLFSEGFGMLKIVFTVILTFIYTKKGIGLEKTFPALFIVCIVQFFISIFVPVIYKFIMNESFNAGFISKSVDKLNVYKLIASMGIVLIPLLIIHLFESQIFSLISCLPSVAFLIICSVILIISVLVNYCLFVWNYNRR